MIKYKSHMSTLIFFSKRKGKTITRKTYWISREPVGRENFHTLRPVVLSTSLSTSYNRSSRPEIHSKFTTCMINSHAHVENLLRLSSFFLSKESMWFIGILCKQLQNITHFHSSGILKNLVKGSDEVRDSEEKIFWTTNWWKIKGNRRKQQLQYN